MATQNDHPLYNIRENIIELIADYLDSEIHLIEETISGFKDPEPVDKTVLHIRMGNAAFNEYFHTVKKQ